MYCFIYKRWQWCLLAGCNPSLHQYNKILTGFTLGTNIHFYRTIWSLSLCVINGNSLDINHFNPIFIWVGRFKLKIYHRKTMKGGSSAVRDRRKWSGESSPVAPWLICGPMIAQGSLYFVKIFKV